MALSAAAIGLLSFHEANSIELADQMHDAGLLLGGNIAVIASGKPLRPSTTAIRMSATPRFLSSVMTRSQNFAPLVCSIQMPSTSFLPSGSTPTAR
jgi:hypothetical protein